VPRGVDDLDTRVAGAQVQTLGDVWLEARGMPHFDFWV
jgi:hypothetical protein